MNEPVPPFEQNYGPGGGATGATGARVRVTSRFSPVFGYDAHDAVSSPLGPLP